MALICYGKSKTGAAAGYVKYQRLPTTPRNVETLPVLLACYDPILFIERQSRNRQRARRRISAGNGGAWICRRSDRASNVAPGYCRLSWPDETVSRTLTDFEKNETIFLPNSRRVVLRNRDALSRSCG
jgi:hypothetical protein